MALAIPVALLIFSMTQPASALKNESNNDNYALYAQAFTQGFAANAANATTNSSADVASCEAPKDETEHSDTGGMGVAMAPVHHAPKHADLVKHINNSYNEYTTNISNKDSNNTVQSVVTVSHSNGAVVSTGTSTSGGVKNDVEVDNEDSNITESLGTLKPGQSVTKEYLVKVTAKTNGSIKNTACFTGDSEVKDNPKQGCNPAVVKVTCFNC